jgi:hypothetical protein
MLTTSGTPERIRFRAAVRRRSRRSIPDSPAALHALRLKLCRQCGKYLVAVKDRKRDFCDGTTCNDDLHTGQRGSAYSFRHSHGDTGCGAALLCFRITPIFGKPAHLLRNSHAPPSLSILRYYYRMAQGTQQTREDSPRYSTRFTIDCVLPLASTQLQADGCVLESLEDGHKLITPDYLRAGDLVRVQLWLEGEEAFVDIPLAVVSKVHTPWITVGVIRVSPTDRLRLKRFIQTHAAMHIGKPAHIDHILIRA